MLSTPETRAREFGAFAPIKDAYPRYVITMDPITQDENGIRHLNLLDFLMDENSLG